MSPSPKCKLIGNLLECLWAGVKAVPSSLPVAFTRPGQLISPGRTLFPPNTSALGFVMKLRALLFLECPVLGLAISDF